MIITFPVFILALLTGFVLTIGFWTWDVTHQFNLGGNWLTWTKNYFYLLSNTFHFKELRGIAFFSILKGFVPAIATLFILHELTDRSQRFISGSRLVTVKELARKTRSKQRKDTTPQITIGAVPMPLSCETNHVAFIGATGKGKTTGFDEILIIALRRGDRLIVLDPNAHALSRFGKKGDFVLNPFDKRSPGWNLFNELRTEYDFQRFAKSVIPNTSDAGEQQWRGYAQQLLAQTMQALSQNGETTNERLVYWLTQTSASDLKALLIGSAAAGLFEPGAEKALASTRFILTTYLNPFQYLRDGKFSLRNWLEKEEGNLYISWREDMLPALRPLVSTWTDILLSSILSLPDDPSRRIWLMLDELGSLEKLNSLEDALTKGRKHGLRVVAGLQSISQLNNIYGVHQAENLRSCFLNLVALGGSNLDAKTAQTVAQGFGEITLERLQISTSDSKNGQSSSKTYQRVTEPLVTAGDLMNLAPLNGFLKFAGDLPVARIALQIQDHPVRIKPFIES